MNQLNLDLLLDNDCLTKQQQKYIKSLVSLRLEQNNGNTFLCFKKEGDNEFKTQIYLRDLESSKLMAYKQAKETEKPNGHRGFFIKINQQLYTIPYPWNIPAQNLYKVMVLLCQ